MKFVGKVHEPMYEFNDIKYIRLINPANISENKDRMNISKC